MPNTPTSPKNENFWVVKWKKAKDLKELDWAEDDVVEVEVLSEEKLLTLFHERNKGS